MVGINSQIYSRSGGFMGISFAIPIDEASRVADQLRATGRVIRGRIGVQIAEVTKEVAESLGLSFGRVQFTPDLLPADITGTDVLEEDQATGRRDFRFVKGPVFAQIIPAVGSTYDVGISSFTVNEERLEAVLPLVAKHGAAVVAITNAKITSVGICTLETSTMSGFTRRT